ncbi:MAG: PorT family protein [Mucilaginibacter polytrichastri]|nr:PorT family protein [Mucilaginibacter polytrichastri]
MAAQFAGAQVPAWGGGNDQHVIDFGFNFQYVSSQYKVLKKADWQEPYLDPENGNLPVSGRLNSISSPASPGFGVGFVSRLKVWDNLDLRFTPSLLFVDRNLVYTFDQTPAEDKMMTVQSTAMDIPLSLKLKTDRLTNVRAYLIGGVKYTGEIGRRKPDDNEAPLDRLVKNKRGFFSYETGIGFDIYFEYFKMSPEIRVSRSFGNVLEAENHPYSRPVDKLFLHNVIFSLLFE